nr:reverse transcriptase domain-containing protein [Tanacetum cinerariifolium]
MPPTSPAYDQVSLGHTAAMIRMRDDIPEEDIPPRRRFVLTAHPPGCDVAGSSAVAARPPRELLTRRESEDFYTQLHDAQTDCKDIRVEIDVVRGQRTTYEAELHEHQRAKDLVVRQMMRIHVLEARAQIDMVEDIDSAKLTWWNGHVTTLGYDAAYAMTWGTLTKKLTDKYCPKGKIKKLEIKLWNFKVRGNDVAAYT